MKISYNWLKTYIDTELPAGEAAEKLTLLGLEVDAVEKSGPDLEGMVAGTVLEVNEHPDADRLRLCRVDLGGKEVQIVCGAPNVAPKQRVAVATVGTALPVPDKDGNRMTVRKVAIRGEQSEGMICSEAELGLGDNHDGILVLPDSTVPGTPLQEVLQPGSDTIFEIALTPNRSDAASHIGVARDLAALLGIPLDNPYREPEQESGTGLEERIDIRIEETERCHRYVAKIVDDLRVSDSPDWLQNRLRSIGLRPVNNVVDVTNFILHEIGQPLHAFDYDKIRKQKISVRSYEQPMTFRTLDGHDREIPADTLFICDGEGPVALAGIMGGEQTEVTGSTRRVLIESAWFEPSSTRKSAKRLGMQTDSSYRFERGVDPAITRTACERAARMIAELAGGKPLSGVTDLRPVHRDPVKVRLRIARLNRLLGTGIESEKAASILEALEIESVASGEGVLECTIPSFRPDLSREVDLIEEIGRVYDYNNIPTPLQTPFFRPAPLREWERFQNRVRELSTRLGYKEIVTNSLHSEAEESHFSGAEERIETLNPVSREATTLRTTLLSGFLKTVGYNLNRNADLLRFFETGNTYRRNAESTWIEGIEEHTRLLLGICGNRESESWRRESESVSLFDLKSDLESLLSSLGAAGRVLQQRSGEESLRYLIDGVEIAALRRIPEALAEAYDIDRPVFAAEIDLTLLQRASVTGGPKPYRKISKFPVFEYDVAYTVASSTDAGELIGRIRETAGDRLGDLHVFDVYEGGNLGEGKKSIAIRLSFSDSNKTLNIKDVEPVIDKITQVLKADLGATLRS